MIHHFLENSASAFPEKTAVITEKDRATYAQVNSDANRLARLLMDHNVKDNDIVVLIMDNSIEYIISYYAILKTGAVVVPFSNDLKPESINHLFSELAPKAVISSKKFERLLKACDLTSSTLQVMIIKDMSSQLLQAGSKTGPRLDFPVIPWSEISNYSNSSNLDKTIDPDTLASIIYTSGSSGIPKGVMLSHLNITTNADSICQYLHLTSDDIQMVVLPFFYVMGKSLLNTLFSVGGTIVINNKFAFPASVINQMVEEKVTFFSGVPSTYAFLLNRSPLETFKDKLTHLRCCTQAGGHMASSIKKKLIKMLPDHTDICIMYGATEASARLTYLEPDRLENKINSIGIPIPGVKIKILDQNNRQVPSGQTGELVASGKNIMLGYWKDPVTTAKALDGNGYHTGDQGYIDEDGFYFIKGRKDSLLKVGGHRINPQEVEDAIMETDLVVESAVIGVKDDLLGNKLIALATPRNKDIDANIILSKCSALLPKYKMPYEIKIVKLLPKNANGKIDKNKCAEMIKDSF
ncbi:MAG: acyl--CoA ligase [Desulfobacula sp.]|uniref:class I adenylate-forming enzyme family protein n=1 Tax=Desulfobacula sp. TaxID=2593537 RepID=UPI0025C6B01F|nr:class I adenylate-forming enzyme family protein [Desulfobacula sp.]MCD4719351.1 acyl--CoA ligase [Desulfobacula sp.]